MSTPLADETRRIIMKVGTGIATVPTSSDHRNGDWIATDIYDGEFYLNIANGKIYTSNAGVIQEVGAIDNIATDDQTITDLRRDLILAGSTAAYTFGVTALSGASMFKVRGDGTINFANLPTSSAGLSAGDIWNNSGVINIV